MKYGGAAGGWVWPVGNWSDCTPATKSSSPRLEVGTRHQDGETGCFQMFVWKLDIAFTDLRVFLVLHTFGATFWQNFRETLMASSGGQNCNYWMWCWLLRQLEFVLFSFLLVGWWWKVKWKQGVEGGGRENADLWRLHNPRGIRDPQRWSRYLSSFTFLQICSTWFNIFCNREPSLRRSD